MIATRVSLIISSMNYRLVFLALVVFFIVAAAGCGSSDGDDSAAAGGSVASSGVAVEDEFEGKWLIAQPDRVYTVEDFKAVGWKKNAQLETETLTGAIDAWYGFFMQKDIELRFYESHELALEHGVEPARETVGRGAGARVGAATVWTVNIALYGAYAVAGNVVMMCELELSACEALVEALE